jgi:hypothetical protein
MWELEHVYQSYVQTSLRIADSYHAILFSARIPRVAWRQSVLHLTAVNFRQVKISLLVQLRNAVSSVADVSEVLLPASIIRAMAHRPDDGCSKHVSKRRLSSARLHGAISQKTRLHTRRHQNLKSQTRDTKYNYIIIVGLTIFALREM